MFSLPELSFTLAIISFVCLITYVVFELYTSYRKYVNRSVSIEIEKYLNVQESTLENRLLVGLKAVMNSEFDPSKNTRTQIAQDVVYLSLFNAIDYRFMDDFSKHLSEIVGEQSTASLAQKRKLFEEIRAEMYPLIEKTELFLEKQIGSKKWILGTPFEGQLLRGRRKRVLQHSAESILRRIQSVQLREVIPKLADHY